METSAPASASAKAIALPIPCLAPVTRATFPAKEKLGVFIATLLPLFLFAISQSISCQPLTPPSPPACLRVAASAKAGERGDEGRLLISGDDFTDLPRVILRKKDPAVGNSRDGSRSALIRWQWILGQDFAGCAHPGDEVDSVLCNPQF